MKPAGSPSVTLDQAPIKLYDEARFGFKKHVDGLVRLLETIPEQKSYVVGVFGDWGQGKTSFLNALGDRLDKHAGTKYKSVYLQVWRFIKEADAYYNLVRDIKAQSQSWTDKGIEQAELWGERGLHVASMVLRGVAKIAANYTSDDFKKLETELAGDRLLLQTKQEVIGAALAKVLGQSAKKGVRHVILLDDVDRVEPEQALGLIEDVKILFSAAPCVFVVALDSKVLRSAIKARYKRLEFDDAEHFSQQYVDKFIDLSWHLPSLTLSDASDFLKDLQNSGPEAMLLNEVERYVFLLGVPLNPRCIKRLLATLTMANLIEPLHDEKLAAERVKRQILSLYFPSLVELARLNPDYFSKVQKAMEWKPTKRWPSECPEIAALRDGKKAREARGRVARTLKTSAILEWIEANAIQLYGLLCYTPAVSFDPVMETEDAR